LNVQPEHYEVVGTELIGAIKEVLGEAATPEIVDAWTEGFGFLANVFIAEENKLRKEMESTEGGWEGWRDFVVNKRKEESSNISSFDLVPKDGGKLPMWKPGQYIGVRVQLPDGTETQRNYSLSCAPNNHRFRITVKREIGDGAKEPIGLVSNYLYQSLKLGSEIKASVPCGDFYLNLQDDGKPIVLCGAGIGITPIVSMLDWMIENNIKRKIYLLEGVRSEHHEAYHGHLQRTASKHLHVHCSFAYDSLPDGNEDFPQGPLTGEMIADNIPSMDCHFYLCGPRGFMLNTINDLKKLGAPREQIYFELFGPHDVTV